VSLTTTHAAAGTTKPAAMTRGKSYLLQYDVLHIYQLCLDHVGTAEKRACPQNNASMDARPVDRHEHAVRGVYLACAARLCTLTASMAPRRHSQPSTCRESLAEESIWPAKTADVITRR
jgi:hypothetical protein